MQEFNNPLALAAKEGNSEAHAGKLKVAKLLMNVIVSEYMVTAGYRWGIGATAGCVRAECGFRVSTSLCMAVMSCDCPFVCSNLPRSNWQSRKERLTRERYWPKRKPTSTLKASRWGRWCTLLVQKPVPCGQLGRWQSVYMLKHDFILVPFARRTGAQHS